MQRVLLVNPINIVHDRNVALIKRLLPEWKIRCLYNPEFPWFSAKRTAGDNSTILFKNGCLPARALDGVSAVLLFTAQPRIPPANLIERAALASIPVIVIEEVYQMMLEQGMVNNYLLPVDYLLAASDYERQDFISLGVEPDRVETTGCMFVSGKETVASAAGSRKKLIDDLGLSAKGKIAVLTLRYITPNGETLNVRRDTLALLQRGLPDNYELIVKPHPGERGNDLKEFIARYAPRAKMVDGRRPITDVLDMADLVFDRGNSQTVVDALARGVPVLAVPMGKRTLFHGVADNVIINSEDDIKDALMRVESQGMSLYKGVRDKYLSIPRDDAVRRTIDRVVEITSDRSLRRPFYRLTELGLFWAWMGYAPKALSVLKKIKSLSDYDAEFACAAARLVSKRPLDKDMTCLKQWGQSGYKQWILQSLYIKHKYYDGSRLSIEDARWLSGYPPRMNRSQFVSYASMLYQLYCMSELSGEAENLRKELSSDLHFAKDIDSPVWRSKLKVKARVAAKNFILRMNEIGATV